MPHEIGNTDTISTKVEAQRLATAFFVGALSELLGDADRKRLQERLAYWAEEADMRGAEDLYQETASLLRFMADRVGEASIPRSL